MYEFEFIVICYYTQQSKTAVELTDFYNRDIDNHENVLQSNFINRFSHPNIPTIPDNQVHIITTDFTWMGLLPTNRYKDFRKSTLNACVETLKDKASFCIIHIQTLFGNSKRLL